jgi:hypothetical protein
MCEDFAFKVFRCHDDVLSARGDEGVALVVMGVIGTALLLSVWLFVLHVRTCVFSSRRQLSVVMNMRTRFLLTLIAIMMPAVYTLAVLPGVLHRFLHVPQLTYTTASVFTAAQWLQLGVLALAALSVQHYALFLYWIVATQWSIALFVVLPDRLLTADYHYDCLILMLYLAFTSIFLLTGPSVLRLHKTNTLVQFANDSGTRRERLVHADYIESPIPKVQFGLFGAYRKFPQRYSEHDIADAYALQPHGTAASPTPVARQPTRFTVTDEDDDEEQPNGTITQ